MIVYKFQTSSGESKVTIVNGKVICLDDTIDNLYDYHSITIKDGWLFIHLEDSYYGTPEYLATRCDGTLEDKKLLAKILLKKQQNARRAPKITSKDPNAWFKFGALHRIDGPAIERLQ